MGRSLLAVGRIRAANPLGSLRMVRPSMADTKKRPALQHNSRATSQVSLTLV